MEPRVTFLKQESFTWMIPICKASYFVPSGGFCLTRSRSNLDMSEFGVLETLDLDAQSGLMNILADATLSASHLGF